MKIFKIPVEKTSTANGIEMVTFLKFNENMYKNSVISYSLSGSQLTFADFDLKRIWTKTSWMLTSSFLQVFLEVSSFGCSFQPLSFIRDVNYSWLWHHMNWKRSIKSTYKKRTQSCHFGSFLFYFIIINGNESLDVDIVIIFFFFIPFVIAFLFILALFLQREGTIKICLTRYNRNYYLTFNV